MKKFVLIMAGGSGKRMDNVIPKQFVPLCGKPMLMHTFQAFYDYDPKMNFILVLPENYVEYWEILCGKHQFLLNYKLAYGGLTRFHSVKNGLDMISDEGIVFIHDGVRPLVSPETIDRCYQTAKTNGNALPVVPVTESIRKMENNSNFSVDRTIYFLVQTPQTFKTGLIKKAYNQEYSPGFTDDASVLESMGEQIYLVEGNRENIKITFPEDLVSGEAFLKNSLQ